MKKSKKKVIRLETHASTQCHCTCKIVNRRKLYRRSCTARSTTRTHPWRKQFKRDEEGGAGRHAVGYRDHRSNCLSSLLVRNGPSKHHHHPSSVSSFFVFLMPRIALSPYLSLRSSFPFVIYRVPFFDAYRW